MTLLTILIPGGEQVSETARALGPLMLLYVGPDQILPLTSFLGALVGILMIFWRYLVSVAGKMRQLFTGRSASRRVDR
jgi:hypothetical protein